MSVHVRSCVLSDGGPVLLRRTSPSCAVTVGDPVGKTHKTSVGNTPLAGAALVGHHDQDTAHLCQLPGNALKRHGGVAFPA